MIDNNFLLKNNSSVFFEIFPHALPAYNYYFIPLIFSFNVTGFNTGFERNGWSVDLDQEQVGSFATDLGLFFFPPDITGVNHLYHSRYLEFPGNETGTGRNWGEEGGGGVPTAPWFRPPSGHGRPSPPPPLFNSAA